MDTELKEALKLLQTIASRACTDNHVIKCLGNPPFPTLSYKDDSFYCDACEHNPWCAANKRLNELLGE